MSIAAQARAGQEEAGQAAASRRRRFRRRRLMALRIVFAGTPEFAVPSLRAAAQRGEVVGVYTQPDRAAGRGRQLNVSPVKIEAIARGIPVLQPENFKSERAREQLRALAPDLLVVIAYGLILPASVLAIPRHGGWNLHASLLPRWRGAAPIQRAEDRKIATQGMAAVHICANARHCQDGRNNQDY